MRTQFVENGDGRIEVQPINKRGFRLVFMLPDGRSESLDFASRKSTLRWLLAACPDAAYYVSNGEVTLCLGSVRGLFADAA